MHSTISLPPTTGVLGPIYYTGIVSSRASIHRAASDQSLWLDRSGLGLGLGLGLELGLWTGQGSGLGLMHQSLG